VDERSSLLVRSLKSFAVDECFSLLVSGLYYKPMMIVNDDSRVINKLETSLTDDEGVIIYDRHMFMVQATGACTIKLFTVVIYGFS
jgi:hypothetical protein